MNMIAMRLQYFCCIFSCLSLMSFAAENDNSFSSTPLVSDLIHGFLGFDDVSSGVVILDYCARKKTCSWHWFPVMEVTPGGESNNNLFAKNGALDRYDKLFDTHACQYECENNRKAFHDDKYYRWWGHVLPAALAACVLSRPQKPVTMLNHHGHAVTFHSVHIEGLMVKIIDNLIASKDVVANDDSNLEPHVFLTALEEWKKERLAFVVEFDTGGEVWHFPYDHVKVSMSMVPPEGFDKKILHGLDFSVSDLSLSGLTKYFCIEISGNEYEQKKRTFHCYVQYDRGDVAIASGWIKEPLWQSFPRRLIRPHVIEDINDRDEWRRREGSMQSFFNPVIDAKLVYDIYLKSAI